MTPQTIINLYHAPRGGQANKSQLKTKTHEPRAWFAS